MGKPLIGFDKLNGKTLPLNDGGGILNKEWKRQGRFYNQTLTYDDFCKEQNRKPTAVFGDPRVKEMQPQFRITDYIARDPEFSKRKIGLDPDAFRDFR